MDNLIGLDAGCAGIKMAFLGNDGEIIEKVVTKLGQG